jgi:hypothetical protein
MAIGGVGEYRLTTAWPEGAEEHPRGYWPGLCGITASIIGSRPWDYLKRRASSRVDCIGWIGVYDPVPKLNDAG